MPATIDRESTNPTFACLFESSCFYRKIPLTPSPRIAMTATRIDNNHDIESVKRARAARAVVPAGRAQAAPVRGAARRATVRVGTAQDAGRDPDTISGYRRMCNSAVFGTAGTRMPKQAADSRRFYPSFNHPGVVPAHSGTKSDCPPIPAVYRRDSQAQIHQFLFIKVPPCLVVQFIGDVA